MRLLPTSLLLSLALAALCAAQPMNLTLQHTDIDDLTPEARAAYEAAYEANDHADHIAAMNSMATAADMAPDQIEMQILFIDLAKAHLRLWNLDWNQAMSMAGRAITAYERVLATPDLPEWAVNLLTEEYEEITDIVDHAEEFYAERMAAGSDYIHWFQAHRERIERIRAVQEARLRAEENE